MKWELPPSKLKELKGLSFVYTSSKHKLEIRSVALIADDTEVAREKHHGIQHRGSIYLLKLPKKINPNNDHRIEVELRSDGGTDSTGKILLVK